MSAPTGSWRPLLAELERRGEATSLDLCQHFGRELAPVLTQLHYLERRRRVARVGLRKQTKGRACVVWRMRPRSEWIEAAEYVPRPAQQQPTVTRTPAQVALREQLFTASVERHTKPGPPGAQTVAEFLALGGVIEVLPGPQPTQFLTVPAFPRSM